MLPAFGHRLDEAKFLSRCVKCNGTFRLLSAEEGAERAAEVFSRDPKREIWECRSCRHQCVRACRSLARDWPREQLLERDDLLPSQVGDPGHA